MADLDPTVLPDELVPLLREPTGYAGIDLRNWALDHIPVSYTHLTLPTIYSV